MLWTESRLVDARGWEEEETGGTCLIPMGISFGVMK